MDFGRLDLLGEGRRGGVMLPLERAWAGTLATLYLASDLRELVPSLIVTSVAGELTSVPLRIDDSSELA